VNANRYLCLPILPTQHAALYEGAALAYGSGRTTAANALGFGVWRPQFIDGKAQGGRDTSGDWERRDAFAALDRAPVGLGHACAICRLDLTEIPQVASPLHWRLVCRHVANNSDLSDQRQVEFCKYFQD
jgi:hypothetical protein